MRKEVEGVAFFLMTCHVPHFIHVSYKIEVSPFYSAVQFIDNVPAYIYREKHIIIYYKPVCGRKKRG